MPRTKRYFGLDKDGEAETPKAGSSTVKKKIIITDSRAFLLTLARTLPFLFEKKIHHFRGAVCYTRCLLGRSVRRVDLMERYESNVKKIDGTFKKYSYFLSKQEKLKWFEAKND